MCSMGKNLYGIIILSLVSSLLVACGRGSNTAGSRSQQVSEPRIEETQAPADLAARILTGADAILQAINVLRAEAGVPALIIQPVLNEIASARATDLAVRSYLGHEDPDTGEVEVKTTLADIGYSGPAAELLLASQDLLDDVPASVTEAWFNDPMHKALLLEPSFRYCGIGMMGDGDVWMISMVLTVGLPEEVTP